jgi:hypothetical protein
MKIIRPEVTNFKIKKLLLLFVAMFFIFLPAGAQPKTDKFLKKLLFSNPYPVFQKVLANPLQYRVQIIYTRINRGKNNHPSFTNYYFHHDPYLYFNPASTVKMPLAFLALEKLNDLNKPGVNKFTTIQFDSAFERQVALFEDTTAPARLPTLAHFIRRAFLISENDPYNRLYQFMGQGEINRNLHQKGYLNTRITRQFMGYTYEQNRRTNPVRFLDSTGKVLYEQSMSYNADTFDFSRPAKLGAGYMNRFDSLIREPFDFTQHNNLPLLDQQQMLQSILFPLSVPEKKRFNLKPDDYAFLYRYLSQYPSETPYPYYEDSLFYDSYVKFFFRDSTHKMAKGVRVFNKVGWAYGFLTDVSYVADFNNKIEYMLAATVYVNDDAILNDNKYEYESIGHPFLYQLGKTIYQYELKRKRKVTPDLSSFKINYEQRDPADPRTRIREVDN